MVVKIVARHLAGFSAAVIFGAGFAVAVTEVILPPARPSFVPRVYAVAWLAIYLAALVYVVTVGIFAAKRWRKKRGRIFEVVTRSLFTTWACVVFAAIVFSVIHR
jgi:hypothetical protein